MTATEQAILHSLIELETAAASLPTADPKPDLRPLFARLNDLTQALPASASPTLLHYLHRRSYGKARLFLEGREAENARGNCHSPTEAA